MSSKQELTWTYGFCGWMNWIATLPSTEPRAKPTGWLFFFGSRKILTQRFYKKKASSQSKWHIMIKKHCPNQNDISPFLKVAKDKQSCLTILVNHHHTNERCELFVKCKGQREGVDLMTSGSLRSSSTQFKARWSKLHCKINAEWNCHVCDPREIRDRTLPEQEKEAKKPFPSVNNVFALRRPTFTFKYHPNLCKQKAQITVHFNFRREFA